MKRIAWLAVLLLALACSPSPKAAPSEPWNLLLISIDTLRADHVSAYRQSERARTPNLDRIADEGILFETVQTVAPTTLPSHASLFTGLSPNRHGVRDNVGFYLSPGHETLASRLEAAGYRTGAFVGAFVLDSRFGLDSGFETYFDDFEEEEGAIAGGLVTHRSGSEVLDRAIAWLDEGEAPSKPFFAFVHFYDPHAPYEAPGSSGGTPEERYGEEVRYVDGLVGELLDWLEQNGEASRTLVVLTSDHGESLGEHGESTHGYFVYQSTLSVPWLLRFPGGPKGLRLSGLVSLVDVTPTLLDVLGLPALEGVDGRSLVPLWESGTLPAKPAYAESFLPRVHFGWSELRSLRDERYKLVLAPRPELYDLLSDPREMENLAPREPDRVRAMAETLLTRLAGDTGTSEPPIDLDRESRERLRALGYLAGGSSASAPAGRGGDDRELVDPKDRVELYELLMDTRLSDVSPSDGARFAEALRELERAIETDPSVPRVYLLYGELLLKGGKIAAAREAFENLLELDPGSFQGHFGLGMAHASAGRLDEAYQEFERARALEPRNNKSYFQLAEIAARRGDWSSAERWLRDAIARNPDRVLTERLAQVLLEAGKAEEARALLVRVVEEHPEDALAAYNLGQMLLVGGDAAGALTQFRRASEISPDADAFQGIGNALVSLGRLDEAVGAYERATAIAPCFTQALSNLGSVHVQAKRYAEAKVCLEKAIACDATYERAYLNLAAVHLEQGALDEAIALLSSGVRANPGSAELKATLEQLERYRAQGR